MSVESSKEAFLQALERLLSQPNAPAPGINAVAREAGLNKVLIYRYFDTWDGLLQAFAQRVNPWRDLRSDAEAGLSAGRWPTLNPFLKWLYRAYLDRLAASPLLQNLLRLSFVDRDPLQAALEHDREVEGLGLFEAAARRFPEFPAGDPAAVSALFIGGLSWLLVAGTRAGKFNGLSFNGDHADAVPRLGSAIDTWVDALTPTGKTSTL